MRGYAIAIVVLLSGCMDYGHSQQITPHVAMVDHGDDRQSVFAKVGSTEKELYQGHVLGFLVRDGYILFSVIDMADNVCGPNRQPYFGRRAKEMKVSDSDAISKSDGLTLSSYRASVAEKLEHMRKSDPGAFKLEDC